eukprot:1842947-Rhodomonas_salina.4
MDLTWFCWAQHRTPVFPRAPSRVHARFTPARPHLHQRLLAGCASPPCSRSVRTRGCSLASRGPPSVVANVWDAGAQAHDLALDGLAAGRLKPDRFLCRRCVLALPSSQVLTQRAVGAAASARRIDAVGRCVPSLPAASRCRFSMRLLLTTTSLPSHAHRLREESRAALVSDRVGREGADHPHPQCVSHVHCTLFPSWRVHIAFSPTSHVTS